MTEIEYEDYITSLNQSHIDYANYIQECKTQIASAITDKGVQTSDEETLEAMANNIKSIARDASSIEGKILSDEKYSASTTAEIGATVTFTAEKQGSLVVFGSGYSDAGTNGSYGGRMTITKNDVEIATHHDGNICTLFEDMKALVFVIPYSKGDIIVAKTYTPTTISAYKKYACVAIVS